jgi:CubicO group peptidase (beta-lactamase class C family)
MNRLHRFVAMLVVILAVQAVDAAEANPSVFPAASPEDVGMSSEKLAEAMKTIEQWVEQKRIVGAILLVVRRDRLVWHEAVGLNDVERGIPMRKDDILLMRSMTKPLTGTGVLMLREEGRLRLRDDEGRVGRYLPAWENDTSREITLFQLLTHTGGIRGGLPRGPTLRAGADAVGERGPVYPPGTRYRYADANSAVLAAVIEEVAGTPADRFLHERILEPLEMRDSFFNHIPEGDPRHARVAVGYRGSSRTGRWRKYRDNTPSWSRGYFGGSGGLYATALDYARFLSMMMKGGEFQGRRILKPETVELALEPHSHYVYNKSDRLAMTRLYGLHWYSWTDRHDIHPWPMSPGSFGHGGAEGTFAWADPQQELICLYLTQSNGNNTRPHVPRMIYDAIVDSD